ncbi:unnamed protein product [Caenorhabditis angaria]|uniref:RRM domain-containing protein n=1 Tax=Caenorhabditis angaria TaxID=860376 RepID=A0A9P1II85_9PELO|nr:unnamed protein product [Caenorhabditis angaria]
MHSLIFANMLLVNDWMDSGTRKAALEKAEAMLKQIAYPDFILSDEKLDEWYKGHETMVQMNLSRESRHVAVHGLPENLTIEKITAFFAIYGKVQKIDKNPADKSVIVSFNDVRSAQKAYQGEHLLDSNIPFTINFHEPDLSMKSATSSQPSTSSSTKESSDLPNSIKCASSSSQNQSITQQQLPSTVLQSQVASYKRGIPPNLASSQNPSQMSLNSSALGLNSSSGSFQSQDEVDIFHPKASRTLYVGGLESRISEENLKRRFSKFGEILDVDVKNFESPSPFAFLQFADIDSSVKAINAHLGANKKGRAPPKPSVPPRPPQPNLQHKRPSQDSTSSSQAPHTPLKNIRPELVVPLEVPPNAPIIPRDPRNRNATRIPVYRVPYTRNNEAITRRAGPPKTNLLFYRFGENMPSLHQTNDTWPVPRNSSQPSSSHKPAAVSSSNRSSGSIVKKPQEHHNSGAHHSSNSSHNHHNSSHSHQSQQAAQRRISGGAIMASSSDDDDYVSDGEGVTNYPPPPPSSLDLLCAPPPKSFDNSLIKKVQQVPSQTSEEPSTSKDLDESTTSIEGPPVDSSDSSSSSSSDSDSGASDSDDSADDVIRELEREVCKIPPGATSSLASPSATAGGDSNTPRALPPPPQPIEIIVDPRAARGHQDQLYIVIL